MPIGYVISVAVIAAGILLALQPLGRSGRLGAVSFFVSAGVNESPFVGFYWVLASTLFAFAQGDLNTPVAWVALALVAVSFIATPVLVRRSLQAGAALEHALAEGLGAGWRSAIDSNWPRGYAVISHGCTSSSPRFPLLPRHRADRESLLRDAVRRNRLDVNRHRSRPSGAPILIHLHGGGFHIGLGGKSFYARPLLMELAR